MSVYQPRWVRLYARKSRALGDPEDLDLFAHQVNPLLRRAEAEGRTLLPAEIVVEVGSGETIDDRPQFRAILEEIERLPPRAGGELWVADVDRLSRGDMMERGRILKACARAGVKIRTTSRTLDLSDPDDELWFEFSSSRGRNELGRFKKRVEARRREMVLAGEPLTGKPPWGYVWDRNPAPGRRRGGYEAHPERFPILQRICVEVMTMSLERLALRYAHYGLNPSTLQWTLRNPAICGHYAHRFGPNDGVRPNNRNRRVLLPRSEWLWAEQPGDWPAACSREQWEAIQSVLDERGTRKTQTVDDAEGWCVDVVRFRGYDRPCRRSSIGKDERGSPNATYELMVGDRRLWVLRQPVHDHAFLVLQETFRRPEIILSSLRDYRERNEAADAVRAREPPRTRLQQELAARRRELDDLLRRELSATGEEAASIARVRSGLRAEIERLADELQAEPDLPERLPALESAFHLIPDFARLFDEAWERSSGSVKRAITRAVIQTLTVSMEPHPSGKNRYVREFGPTLLQSWLPFGSVEELGK